MAGKMSVYIASADSPDTARALLEKAIQYYDSGVVNEDGYMIFAAAPATGAAQVYVWPEK